MPGDGAGYYGTMEQETDNERDDDEDATNAKQDSEQDNEEEATNDGRDAERDDEGGEGDEERAGEFY